MNESMRDKADCRTAPATLGLLNITLKFRYNCFPCDYNACVDCAMKESLLIRSRRGTLVARLALTGIALTDYNLFRSRTASRSCSRNTSRCPSVNQSRRNSRDLGRGASLLPEGHRRLLNGPGGQARRHSAVVQTRPRATSWRSSAR